VIETLHGVEVPDPYRWLEDGDDPAVATWAAAQNARTREALDALPQRAGWHERLVALLQAPVVTGCRLAGDWVFTLERGGGAPQHALVVRRADDKDAPARRLVDPAELAADAAAAIDWYEPSPDGALVAYGVSQGGDERSTLRVLDVATGTVLADQIPETRAASVAWHRDASGFAYTRYPEGDEYHRRVYEHRLGTDWHDDPLLWGDLPTAEAWPSVDISDDDRWVLVHVMVGWSRVDVHLLDRTTGKWRTVIQDEEAVNAFAVDTARNRLIGTTTLDAPRGRVVTAALDTPEPASWVTLVPEGEAVIEGTHRAGDELLVRTTASAMARLDRYTSGGQHLGSVELPGLVAFAGLDSDPDRALAFCCVEGFTRPAMLLRWDGGATLEPWVSDESSVPDITVRYVRYPSLDGTGIGLFLIHRPDVVPGPDTACFLTGYGGFAVSLLPAWAPLAAAWAERGGLVAVAGLRGGTEEGEEWHRAGRREHKQRVFEDFEAAADWLVANGLTSRDRLALRGGSNGGLLVGATLTRRPDIAAAVHCAVPLLDMIRYPQFLIARLWTDEYGDPDVAGEFKWLWGYSPYHHVHRGTCYPSVLFTAAEGDSRVDALHARKMAALLQWASACADDRPILLRQEGRAGHGVGKPLAKQADELADVAAFFTWRLGGP